MNKHELIEQLTDKLSFEQVQGLDIEELQDTYILYFKDDLKIEWLEACSYHGFEGSLNEYIQGLLDTERDIQKALY
jgi:hypothetical protein